MEDFCIYCPILEVSMLDRKVSGKISGVALTIGEVNTNDKPDEGTCHSHVISEGLAETSRNSSETLIFYQNDLAMRNTADK
jgi:hypothetical protein